MNRKTEVIENKEVWRKQCLFLTQKETTLRMTDK